MKVLMLSRGVVPIRAGCGGAELAAHQLARHLARRGHDVTLVSDVDDSISGDRVDRLVFVPLDSRLQRLSKRLPGGFVPWLLQHLVANIAVTALARGLMRRQRFDLVHAHGALSALLLTSFADVPVAYTEQDAPPWLCRHRRWWERMIRWAIYRVFNVTAWRRVDRVGVTFPSLRDELINRWDVPASHVFTIANGADIDLFHPEAPTAGEKRHYCLFVGRLTSRKAPDLLLRAMARVPEVSCAFAGDGPMRAELERLADELGVRDRVEFLGSLDSRELPHLYSDADLLVLPSFSEASPLVAAEAMACGTPVLATRIAGLPALVDDFETGFLVTPGDVGELAVALRFLTRDAALLSAMGHAAETRAEERLAWPTLAGEYEGVYRSAGRFTREPERVAATR
jgi:glycosyltransferase involved in cell wall biosynthesis